MHGICGGHPRTKDGWTTGVSSTLLRRGVVTRAAHGVLSDVTIAAAAEQPAGLCSKGGFGARGRFEERGSLLMLTSRRCRPSNRVSRMAWMGWPTP
jgi:hypothetical protein